VAAPTDELLDMSIFSKIDDCAMLTVPRVALSARNKAKARAIGKALLRNSYDGMIRSNGGLQQVIVGTTLTFFSLAATGIVQDAGPVTTMLTAGLTGQTQLAVHVICPSLK
jgi:hypothetical protein